MWFDVQSALKEIEQDRSRPEPSVRAAAPDLDAFEERAAIVEFDAGILRKDAEQFAAQLQGYSNVVSFKVAARKAKGGEQ